MKRRNDAIRVTLTVSEAAEIAGCGTRAIRDGVARGIIPHFKLGRVIYIPKNSFLKWIEAYAQVHTDARLTKLVEQAGRTLVPLGQ